MTDEILCDKIPENEDTDHLPYLFPGDLPCRKCGERQVTLRVNAKEWEYGGRGPDVKCARLKVMTGCLSCGEMTNYRVGAMGPIDEKASFEQFFAKRAMDEKRK